MSDSRPVIDISDDPLSCCIHTPCRNSAGSTPLHLAAETGHTAVVEYLLRQRGMGRVKAALDNDGKSPLAVCLEFKMNDWQKTAELLREAYKVS